jgi:hypothetical protein
MGSRIKKPEDDVQHAKRQPLSERPWENILEGRNLQYIPAQVSKGADETGVKRKGKGKPNEAGGKGKGKA